MRYEVTSDADCVVDGLGVFKKGKPQVFDAAAAKEFKSRRGIELKEGNLPKGVTIKVLDRQPRAAKEGGN